MSTQKLNQDSHLRSQLVFYIIRQILRDVIISSIEIIELKYRVKNLNSIDGSERLIFVILFFIVLKSKIR